MLVLARADESLRADVPACHVYSQCPHILCFCARHHVSFAEDEPAKQVMPEVEPVTGPMLYAKARKLYSTEQDSSGKVAFKGMIEPETASAVASENWPGVAEKGWLPGKYNEDRHPWLC